MTKIRTQPSDRLFWIAAAAIVVFVYFFGLTIPLLGPDEPRYAQVAREMFERRDWITPTLGGHHWFEKPALLYWLQILAYSLFGVSEFPARLGSALFGLGTAASMWILGRAYAAETAEGNAARPIANWFALIAASSLGLIVFARGASFDIIVTFPITAAMASFYVFDSRLRHRSVTGDTNNIASYAVPLSLFYFFIGVSLLAKGLIGIVFPFAIVSFYLVLSRRWPSRMLLISLVWGTLLSLAVASAWYLPMYLRHGWEFVDEFFIQHHFQRYTSNKYLHPQPFHFFFWVLPLMTIPWLPFFFAAVWIFVKRFFQKADAAGPAAVASNHLLIFSAAWLAVPLVFFSFSGSKLPGYIMPALPPAAAITSIYLLGFMNINEARERWVKALAMATFAVVVGIIIFILPKFADMDSVKRLIADADARGHNNEPVLTLHTVSHNAEFYAPGRLIRDAEGKQKRLNGPAEVLAEVRRSPTRSALVLVPVEHQRHLEDSPLLSVETIRSNGEYTIARVREP